MQKKWYLSKTLWANVVMLVSSIVMEINGVGLSVETQASIMAGVNMVLRFVTTEGLSK